MKKNNLNILLALLAIGIIVISLLWAGNAEFGGTDNKAVDIIASNNYTPWFDYLITPASPVVESFLFSLQAALGAGVLFYFIGYFRGRHSATKNENK